MQSDEWKALKNHHPDVANNLLEKVVTYKGDASRSTYGPPSKRFRIGNDLTPRFSYYGNNVNGAHRFVFQP